MKSLLPWILLSPVFSVRRSETGRIYAASHSCVRTSIEDSLTTAAVEVPEVKYTGGTLVRTEPSGLVALNSIAASSFTSNFNSAPGLSLPRYFVSSRQLALTSTLTFESFVTVNTGVATYGAAKNASVPTANANNIIIPINIFLTTCDTKRL